MSKLYANTDDKKDIVTLEEIKRRYTEMQGTINGFDEYVESGFVDGITAEYEPLTAHEIKNATAIYTGGNIYIYYGELTNGLWFRACDGEEFIEICNADTSTEDADYYEFYEEHSIETLTAAEYETFWNEMLLWIIHNAPTGNYNVDELERRMIKSNETDSLKLKNDGYIFVSSRGIEYELLEGVSIGQKKQYTSDIIFIVLMDSDYCVEEMVVGYLFGASVFANDLKGYEESIREQVEEFEKKHF